MNGNDMSGNDPLGAGEFQEQGQDAGLGDEEITADEASGATAQDDHQKR